MNALRSIRSDRALRGKSLRQPQQRQQIGFAPDRALKRRLGLRDAVIAPRLADGVRRALQHGLRPMDRAAIAARRRRCRLDDALAKLVLIGDGVLEECCLHGRQIVVVLSTGVEQRLIGKVGSVFTSTASQHGGQETTIQSFHTTLLHQGMIVVGLPYSAKELLTMTEITGGTPYGASTITSGDGSRQPSANELTLARFQGKHVAEIAAKLFG